MVTPLSRSSDAFHSVGRVILRRHQSGEWRASSLVDPQKKSPKGPVEGRERRVPVRSTVSTQQHPFFFCSSLTNFRLFFCFFFLLFLIVIPWFPLSFLLSGLWVCSQIEKRKFFKILQKVRQKERLTLFWVCITRAGHQRLMKNNCQDFYHFFHLKKLSLLN